MASSLVNIANAHRFQAVSAKLTGTSNISSTSVKLTIAIKCGGTSYLTFGDVAADGIAGTWWLC